jgi:hypothetical protein
MGDGLSNIAKREFQMVKTLTTGQRLELPFGLVPTLTAAFGFIGYRGVSGSD